MNNAKSKNVFISMGTPYTAEQIQFQEDLIALVEENQLVARVINKTDYPTGNPLIKIKSVLAECDAAIVVAFERTYFKEGMEKRFSQTNKKQIEDVKYTTPWNQIEAAMGYAFGLPIYVLMENNIREEGLLEEKYEWYIDRLEISGTSLRTGDSRKRLTQWCREIHAAKPEESVPIRLGSDTTLNEIFQTIPIQILWKMGSAIAGFFAACMALAYYMGTHFPDLIKK